MVIATGSLLEVDPVIQVFTDLGIAHLKDDPERAGRCEGGVGVERVTQLVLFQAIGQLRGTVCADRNDRKTQLRELRLQLAQLTELRCAIRSPAPAIEDEQRTPVAQDFG